MRKYVKSYKVFISFVILILGIANFPAYALVPGGMIANDYEWDNVPVYGFDSIEVPMLISHEPGKSGFTFWANQFDFKNGDTGYFGIQQRSGSDKYLNFSIWKATSWKTGFPANCRSFDHEGEGIQCDIPYNWQEGVKYLLKVTKNSDNSVSAFVRNTQTNETIEIARINTSPTWGGFTAMQGFVENYYQTDGGYKSCSEVPATTSATFAATANGNIKSKAQTAYTYGLCQQIAKSFCSVDQSCVATINSSL